MAHQVLMPKWGLTMKTGKIARWLVAEGASLEAGQPLLEVETDKITNVWNPRLVVFCSRSLPRRARLSR